MDRASEVAGRRLAVELRTRHLGHAQIARMLREQHPGISARKAMRLAWGWTQDQAAAEWFQLFGERRAAKQFSYWENWPISGHAPSLDTLDQLARLYRCSVVDLLADQPDYGSDPEPDQPPRQRPSSAAGDPAPSSPAMPGVSLAQGPLDSGALTDPVTRGWFFGHAATGVVTLLNLLNSQAELDELADRVNAVRSGRARIDNETLTGLADVTLGYRRAYRSASAATLLGPVYGTLGLLVDLAPEAGADQRDGVVSMIGQVAALLGTILMLDLGDYEAAKPYLAITARAAQQIDNGELLAFAMGCQAFRSTYSGQQAAGLAFADGALELAARGIPPRTHGWLAAVASEMHATHHHELACERLLDTAANQLTHADDAEPWLGIGAFNADKLLAYRGGDLVRLGRYSDAQVELHRALKRLDPSLKKHRATACIDLAEAYVADGKVDDGAHHAIEALNIVAGTRHASSLQRVEALHRQLAPTRTPTVRLFGEKLLELKAAS